MGKLVGSRNNETDPNHDLALVMTSSSLLRKMWKTEHLAALHEVVNQRVHEHTANADGASDEF